MKVTIANTPLVIEGAPAEIAELFDLMTAGGIELSVSAGDAAPASAPGAAAGKRPRCTTCGRIHKIGACKHPKTNGRKPVPA